MFWGLTIKMGYFCTQSTIFTARYRQVYTNVHSLYLNAVIFIPFLKESVQKNDDIKWFSLISIYIVLKSQCINLYFYIQVFSFIFA